MQLKISKKHTLITAVLRPVIIAATAWMCTIPISAQAQENSKVQEVSTAIPLLRIAPDTRSAAMGEASLAGSADAASSMTNVAKSVFADQPIGLSIHYAPWLRDISSESYLLSLGGYQKIGNGQSITASLRYFTSGRIEERDYNNTLIQLITPTEFAFDMGYSKMLSEQISMGITFRYINSSIGKSVSNASGAAHAFAADVSAYYNGLDEEGKGLTAGMTIANLGTAKITYGQGSKNEGFLPAKIGLGMGYTIPFQNNDKFRILGEFNKSLVPVIPTDEEGFKKFQDYTVLESYGKGIGNSALHLSAGVEYEYQDLLFLRTGYYTESLAYGGRKYISVGAGIKYQSIGLDLAYIVPSGEGINRNALSNTLRMGLTFDFSGK